MCPENSFVTAMNARVEAPTNGDETALNGIKIRCRYNNWDSAGDLLV